MRPPEDRSGLIGWLQWFLTTDEGIAAYVRDVLTSAGTVVLVGLLNDRFERADRNWIFPTK